MIASKSQKKRKKGSKWITSNLQDHTVKICKNEGFTIYETDALVLAAPGKKTQYSVEANLMTENFSKQKNRRLGKPNILGLKRAKVQSLNKYHDIKESSNKVVDAEENKRPKIECFNTHEDSKPIGENDATYSTDDEDEIEVTSDRVESRKCVNSDIDECIDQCNGTELINEQKDNYNNNRNIDYVNSESDDEENMGINELLISHPASIDGSSDSKSDCTPAMEESDFDETTCGMIDEKSLCSDSDLYDYHLYKIENNKKYILHLPCHRKFYFQGKIQVTLLYGKIEVFGYELSHCKKNKTLQLYSPQRCMQLYILSKFLTSTLDSNDVKEMLQGDLKLSHNDLEKLFSSFKSDDSLLLVEKVFVPCSLILSHYCDTDFFLQKKIFQKGGLVEKDLGCFLNKTELFENRGFTLGKDWENIKPKKCTVLCGGKGVGKSTLLKFLINSQLTHEEVVLCLDLDPGQTEFTPPGCVSAVVLRKPLLGPNFTNITTPNKMAFIGIFNVALDPVKYMKAVNFIVQECKQDPELSDLPWFVNTMGFNKGIGLDIMINIIKLLQPSGVVQIHRSDRSRNYEIGLRPESVGNYPVLSLIPMQTRELKYELYFLRSCSGRKGEGFQSNFRPAELREFMILSYFSPVVSLPYCSLNAVQPRWKHFSKIYIALDTLIESNYILKAVNGNLVGLCNINGVECTAKSNATRDSNKCFLKLAIQPEVAPCFGIGLVRGIDCSEEKIYIVTPLSNEELENVNCLYLGNVDTPSSIYLKQKYVNEPTVYTDVRGTRNSRSLKHNFKYMPQLQKNYPE